MKLRTILVTILVATSAMPAFVPTAMAELCLPEAGFGEICPDQIVADCLDDLACTPPEVCETPLGEVPGLCGPVPCANDVLGCLDGLVCPPGTVGSPAVGLECQPAPCAEDVLGCLEGLVCPPGTVGAPDAGLECQPVPCADALLDCLAGIVCPVGTVGVPPNCDPLGDVLCEVGTVGVPPNCQPIDQLVCPVGTVGVPPNCQPIDDLVCPTGTIGIPPDCEPAPGADDLLCPIGTVGIPPDCDPIENPCEDPDCGMEEATCELLDADNSGDCEPPEPLGPCSDPVDVMCDGPSGRCDVYIAPMTCMVAGVPSIAQIALGGGFAGKCSGKLTKVDVNAEAGVARIDVGPVTVRLVYGIINAQAVHWEFNCSVSYGMYAHGWDGFHRMVRLVQVAGSVETELSSCPYSGLPGNVDCHARFSKPVSSPGGSGESPAGGGENGGYPSGIELCTILNLKGYNHQLGAGALFDVVTSGPGRICGEIPIDWSDSADASGLDGEVDLVGAAAGGLLTCAIGQPESRCW